jgi:site-specific recombinase XerD
MPRHSRGSKLANDGAAARALRERFGYQNIRYTELTTKRFKDFWRNKDR